MVLIPAFCAPGILLPWGRVDSRGPCSSREPLEWFRVLEGVGGWVGGPNGFWWHWKPEGAFRRERDCGSGCGRGSLSNTALSICRESYACNWCGGWVADEKALFCIRSYLI